MISKNKIIKSLVIGLLGILIPQQALAECDSWVDPNSYSPSCMMNSYDKSKNWVSHIYQKNANLCNEDEFFIEETTAVLGVGVVAIVGVLGVAATKVYLIPSAPGVYNSIHQGICGTKLKKTDDEIVQHINKIIDGTINKLIP